MYLIDTNICIYFMQGCSEPLRLRMREAVAKGLAMSAITYSELAADSRQSRDPAGDKKLLDTLVQIVVVQPFDRDAAQSYGTLVRRMGVPRRSFDRLIAAHALALGAMLITDNEAAFADISGLKIENWIV